MIALPLPFVVALVLGIYAGRLCARWDVSPGVRRPAIFAFSCAVLLVSVGLRWQVDGAFFRFLQPVLASMLPVIAWLCFASFDGPVITLRRLMLHGPFVGLVFLCSLTWPYWYPPIDFLLCGQFLVYGGLLMRRAGAGESSYGDVCIGDIGAARRIVAVVGGVLMLSAVIDGAIALDFAWQRGLHAREIVASGNAVILAFCVFLLVRLGSYIAPPEQTGAVAKGDAPAPITTAQARADLASDRDIAAEIDQLMQTRKLYHDPDLTLDRLARRAVIPARAISLAINRYYGRNISCIINEYRIAEAMHLLSNTAKTITEIQFDCGFQSKSNFNREFRRVAGMNPRDYRSQNADTPAKLATPFNAGPKTPEPVA
ncbi:AraC family transcriptional regulator [Thalassospira sp. TSL5-1]|uniref:helix-turn-helix domain-containing protein n=1 Tax=Thalassospira sp. TSL5-1 TaxID=1544451 RepID=UPI00096002A6|nr:AraC family transcriptional regulator [Thalassospira sp. TSL5-1]OKH86601.1 hypothetical protein LF95_21820 [Thalassospira sp. TSL5-1]